MMWKRELGPSYYHGYDFLLTVLIILTIVGLFVGRATIFTIVGLYVIYFIVYTVFDKRIENNIVLKNPHHVIRLFPGEEDVLRFHFVNRSIFPMINGKFSFQSDLSIHAKDFSQTIDKHARQYHVPVSLVRRGNTSIELPIYGEKRGTARIRNISYKFPHLFNFDNVTLRFSPFFKKEIIVYPRLTHVKGIESIFEMTPGSHPIQFSPFEDVQDRIGTRDYHYHDSFKRINWKVSAKAQKLQTNVYEKVTDISYMFIVNIGTKIGHQHIGQLNETLENLLSYTAYLCKYATEKGFPFEMFINVRKPGSVPFLHLDEGEGESHLATALEMLARIQQQPMMVPFDKMLHRIGQKFSKPQSIVIIGNVYSNDWYVIDSWKRMQKNIFRIYEGDGKGAVLTRWENDVPEMAE